ncbi:MAG: hypothetical protein AAB295_08555, partial [Chloroflexota bacterium]
MHPSLTRGGQTPPAFGETARATQRSEPAPLKPLQKTPDCPRRDTERSRNLDLRRAAKMHERRHRVRLSHPVADRVLRDRNPGHDDHAAAAGRHQQTASVDDDASVGLG